MSTSDKTITRWECSDCLLEAIETVPDFDYSHSEAPTGAAFGLPGGGAAQPQWVERPTTAVSQATGDEVL